MSNPLYTKGPESRLPSVCVSHAPPIIQNDGLLTIELSDLLPINTPEGVWQMDGMIEYNDPAWPPGTGFSLSEDYIDLDQPLVLHNGTPDFLTLVAADLDHVFFLMLTDPNGSDKSYFFSIRQLLHAGGLP